MTDTDHGEEERGEDPKRPSEGELRAISEVVDGIVVQEMAHAAREGLQEPDITAGLARVLSREPEKYRFGRFAIRVEVETFPSHGRGALERKVGADLYISIIVPDARGVTSKGFLVQAKLARARRDSRLEDQAGRMIEPSQTASYVFVYQARGIDVFPASAVAGTSRLPSLQHQPTVGQLVADGIRCPSGDRGIGRRVIRGEVEPLRSAMERVGAKAGLGLELVPALGLPT